MVVIVQKTWQNIYGNNQYDIFKIYGSHTTCLIHEEIKVAAYVVADHMSFRDQMEG